MGVCLAFTVLCLYPICSAISLLSFVFFGSYRDFGRREALLALIATALYHTVLLGLNAYGVVDGPYRYLM